MPGTNLTTPFTYTSNDSVAHAWERQNLQNPLVITEGSVYIGWMEVGSNYNNDYDTTLSSDRSYYFDGSVWQTAQVGFGKQGNILIRAIITGQRTVSPFTGTSYTITTQKFAYNSSTDNSMDLIKVVPNPYIIRADWDRSDNTRKIQFTHLPSKCTIRIYTLAGILIRKIEHTSTIENGGSEDWDIRTQDDQIPASGVYIYCVSTTDGKKKLGKFALLR